MKRYFLILFALVSGLGAFSACGKEEEADPAGDNHCDDGIFCNGIERITSDGSCLSSPPPCDDGTDCTEDTCDEATQLCGHILGANCDSCSVEDCVPDCSGRECGDDGCGHECGTCTESGTACALVEGQCVQTNSPGTCINPLPLLPEGTELDGRFLVEGDTTNGTSEVTPTCNGIPSVELVYELDVTEPTGVDARAEGIDSVLHIRKENPDTPGNECFNDSPEVTIACNDDSSPPADGGSRVTALLSPGKYYFIVDGFDAESYGEFELELTFVPNCVPLCDGRYCGGSNGCGGDCGTCDSGEQCVKGSCVPDPCTPDCSGRDCGDDGCGGDCGTCAAGLFCTLLTGTCDEYPQCDHDDPDCGTCDDDEFCGTDCRCYDPDDPMPDLIVDRDRLANEILFETREFNEDSCGVAEGCVDGLGARRLLRFSVEAGNQGQASIDMPPPDTRPDLFEWSPCHRHFHFRGFAVYELLDDSGDVVLTGRKQAFCMTDSEQFLEGPDIACRKEHHCTAQGIGAGWSDLYGNSLDCQWLDVTDVPPGDYQLRVRLNPEHNFQEQSFDNNQAVVSVTID